MSQIRTFLQIHPADNVLVALQDLKKGEIIQFNGDEFPLANDIDAKHKFTTEAVALGQSVTMYGVLVGKAVQDIPKGGMINIFKFLYMI